MRYDARPDSSTLSLWTYKEGLLSRVAHDLAFAATAWRAPLEVDAGRVRIEVVVPVSGLRVQGQVSNGVVTPLAPKDHREIEGNVAGPRVLHAAAHPELRWRGEAPLSSLAEGSRATIEGRLTLRGVERPLPVVVLVRGAGADLVVEGEVRFKQSPFGITPYSALLGALRVQDEVRVAWSIAYPRPA
jgi:hypothetical protein